MFCRIASLALVAAGCFLINIHSAHSQSSGTPGTIIEGSSNTTIGGAAAARQGDRTSNTTVIVEGSSDVFINGKPAATLGDHTGCGGVAIGGASGVFINGKPVVRAGDVTTGCPRQ